MLDNLGAKSGIHVLELAQNLISPILCIRTRVLRESSKCLAEECAVVVLDRILVDKSAALRAAYTYLNLLCAAR
jgi:hypothetical protein